MMLQGSNESSLLWRKKSYVLPAEERSTFEASGTSLGDQSEEDCVSRTHSTSSNQTTTDTLSVSPSLQIQNDHNECRNPEADSFPARSLGIGATLSSRHDKNKTTKQYMKEVLDIQGYPSRPAPVMNSKLFHPPTKEQISAYNNEIVTAVREGNVEKLRALIDFGNNRPDACNRFGESIVHIAARNAHADILRFLIEKGASVNLMDDYGRTPLHDACWFQNTNFEVAEILLYHSPDMVRAMDKRGDTPLDYIPDELQQSWKEFFAVHCGPYWTTPPPGGYIQDPNPEDYGGKPPPCATERRTVSVGASNRHLVPPAEMSTTYGLVPSVHDLIVNLTSPPPPSPPQQQQQQQQQLQPPAPQQQPPQPPAPAGRTPSLQYSSSVPANMHNAGLAVMSRATTTPMAPTTTAAPGSEFAQASMASHPPTRPSSCSSTDLNKAQMYAVVQAGAGASGGNAAAAVSLLSPQQRLAQMASMSTVTVPATGLVEVLEDRSGVYDSNDIFEAGIKKFRRDDSCVDLS